MGNPYKINRRPKKNLNFKIPKDYFIKVLHLLVEATPFVLFKKIFFIKKFFYLIGINIKFKIMSKFKNYTRLLAVMLIGLFFFSCNEEDSQDFISHERQSNMISERIATEIASNIIFESENDKSSAKRTNTLLSHKKIEELTPIKNEKSEIIFYVINYEKGGFIILSADNRTFPILAFSESNNFSLEEESYPSGLVEWLSLTKEGITSIRSKNTVQSDALKVVWKSFMSPRIVDPIDPNDCEDEFEQVGPLLTTRWHQRCGFNDFMPTLNCDNVPCGRAFAGCVPIAIAQVMRYHEHPANYNWSSMPTTFGTTTTASLISDIHDAITINIFGDEYPAISYDCDGTGVDKDYNTAGVFTNKFGYSSANQGGYNYETVKQQLRRNQPVILGGGRDAGWWIFHDYTDGHMWVCDGFRRSEHCIFDDHGNLITKIGRLSLHMNWGWVNGQHNGWYSFDNFNPGDFTFNYQVKMVYNIKP